MTLRIALLGFSFFLDTISASFTVIVISRFLFFESSEYLPFLKTFSAIPAYFLQIIVNIAEADDVHWMFVKLFNGALYKLRSFIQLIQLFLCSENGQEFLFVLCDSECLMKRMRMLIEAKEIEVQIPNIKMVK